MKTKEKQPEASNAPEETIKVEYNNAFVLKGNNLQPFITNPETSAKIAQDKQSLEKKFKNETELSNIVLHNGKILFGEQTILIDCLTKNNIELSGGFVPDGLLFDLRENEKPRFYFIEVALSKDSLADLLLRITRLFSLVRTKENLSQFTVTLAETFRKNIGLRNKLKPAFGDKGAYDFLQYLFTRPPVILLVLDNPIQELAAFVETYTWGESLKQMFVRKFGINGEIIITISPTLAELNNKKNGKRNGTADKVIKATEEDHTESVSETVKEIFLEIKSELQKVNIDVEFRVKQHYISLRKDRNLAFFQLGKKKLSIVIANPEKNMQKQIKHHDIRTLADSVKKFWNGNEHCFTVVVENQDYLDEITSMLKKMIGNGKSEDVTSDAPAEAPQEGAIAGKIKSQAKPKRKKSKK